MKKLMNTRTFLFLIAIIGIATFVGCSAGGSGADPTTPPPAQAALVASGPAPVVLGTAVNYSILSTSTIGNTGVSAVVGDVAVQAGNAAITGFGLIPGLGQHYYTSLQVVPGKIYTNEFSPEDTTLVGPAMTDMGLAYADAAGRNTDLVSSTTVNIGGMTFAPGLYAFTNAVTIPVAGITLSGNAASVWIFQITGALTVDAATIIHLDGGALPQNIFWQLTDAVTLGAGSTFEGILLPFGAVTVGDGATLHGKILGHAITLTNAVVKP